MALIDTLIKQHGKVQGRKLYNEWHREYRKRNKAKMLKYWKSRREAEKSGAA
jgi:hypothetical protein